MSGLELTAAGAATGCAGAAGGARVAEAGPPEVQLGRPEPELQLGLRPELQFRLVPPLELQSELQPVPEPGLQPQLQTAVGVWVPRPLVRFNREVIDYNSLTPLDFRIHGARSSTARCVHTGTGRVRTPDSL